MNGTDLSSTDILHAGVCNPIPSKLHRKALKWQVHNRPGPQLPIRVTILSNCLGAGEATA